MTSQELNKYIDEILAGDSSRYTVIVNTYKDYVFTLAFRMLDDVQHAEEVAQDSFLKAYRMLASYREEAKFTTWLYRITYNTALDFLKKKKIYFEELSYAEEFQVENKDSLSSIIEKESAKTLTELINQLPKIDTAILSLYYFDELSIKEIGEVTSMKPNTVKQRLHRARNVLAKKREAKNLLKEIYE